MLSRFYVAKKVLFPSLDPTKASTLSGSDILTNRRQWTP